MNLEGKEESDRWKRHAEKLEGIPPRPLLVEALAFVDPKDEALDLGPGALSDTKYLLSQNFLHVTAVDISDNAHTIASELPSDRFEYIISSFENFDFPEHKYDLINAQYSLPFNSSETFDVVFERVKKSLKPQGIFTGTLFGTKDSWYEMRKDMSFHTLKQVQELFLDMKLIKFREEERNGRTVSGEEKHWHIYNIIACKK